MLKTILTSTTSDQKELWMQIVNAAPDAWFWHCWQYIHYRKTCLEEIGIPFQDLSMFVYEDEVLVGLIPLVICSIEANGQIYHEASFLGSSLPWPCTIFTGDDRDRFDNFSFAEIHRIAREQSVARIDVFLSPANKDKTDYNRFSNQIFKYKYLDTSYLSHHLSIGTNTLANVRDRYKRYVRKFLKQYETRILTGQDISDEAIETYEKLHTLDAGRTVRSSVTYREQAQVARDNFGFWAVAKCRQSKETVGILQISMLKGACYDASVAVHPDHQENHISHLLKWQTIEHLKVLGVKSYEFGEIAKLPTFLRQPDRKNYGISFFKNGWTRGEEVLIYRAETFLSDDYMAHVMGQRMKASLAFLKS